VTYVKQVAGFSGGSETDVASPKFWEVKSFDFKRATVFCLRDSASQRTKRRDMLEIWERPWPHLATPMVWDCMTQMC